MSHVRLNNESMKYVTNFIVGTPRNFLLGAGLSYAIQNELYTHIPFIFLTPSIYAGYQSHNNKDSIITWIIEQKKKYTKWF
jgi:hypothetical protein